jgi:hypothetical protein
MNIVMDITDGGRKEVGSLRHVFCFNPSQLTCWTYSSCIVPFTRSSGASPGGYEWTTETETAFFSTQNRRDLAGCENLIWYNYNIYILKRRWPIPIYIYISKLLSTSVLLQTDSVMKISAVGGLKISHAHEARRDVPANVGSMLYEASGCWIDT